MSQMIGFGIVLTPMIFLRNTANIVLFPTTERAIKYGLFTVSREELYHTISIQIANLLAEGTVFIHFF